MSLSVLVSGVVLGQPMGGVRRHNAELLPRIADLLARDGDRLAVLEGREPIAFPLPETVERLSADVAARPPLVRSMAEGPALARVVRAGAASGAAYDLIHTAHLPVPRSLPLPYTLTIHDLRALELQHTPFSRRFVARHVIGDAVRRAAGVIAVSEAVRADLLERFALEPTRVHVVSNAADHLAPLDRRPAPGAPILCVGHLEPRKNLEVVLRALAHDSELPALELAGAAKGDERERLARVADELGVTGRVRFLGPFEDARLAELYARAACVVLPSRVEGFGIVAIEAQRAGVPLAVARAPALIEVAGEVPTFDADDPVACAAAIRAALRTTEDERNAAAERAGRFRWDTSARAWVDAWRRTLARPVGR